MYLFNDCFSMACRSQFSVSFGVMNGNLSAGGVSVVLFMESLKRSLSTTDISVVVVQGRL